MALDVVDDRRRGGAAEIEDAETAFRLLRLRLAGIARRVDLLARRKVNEDDEPSVAHELRRTAARFAPFHSVREIANHQRRIGVFGRYDVGKCGTVGREGLPERAAT